MPVRIAINGFGRIGRSFLRAVLARRNDDIVVVAINDLADPRSLAHLLRYDSVTGPLPYHIDADDDSITVDGRRIAVFSKPDPSILPWGDLGVRLVVESTGVFTDARKAEAHLEAGAHKVLISAPATNEDLTLVYGINHDRYDRDKHSIVSNASCTTNCLAPLARVLHETVGIEHGQMTTIHAYTQDQNLQDGPHRDLRRARAAALNLIPTTTGAAKAIGLVLPELNGKLDGFSLRVPVPVGSLTDLTIQAARDTSAEEVNAAFAAAASSEPLGAVLDYTDAPIVSTDIIGSTASCIFDAGLTKVVNGRSVKVGGWYDNEYGFSNRLIDAALLVGNSEDL